MLILCLIPKRPFVGVTKSVQNLYLSDEALYKVSVQDVGVKTNNLPTNYSFIFSKFMASLEAARAKRADIAQVFVDHVRALID